MIHTKYKLQTGECWIITDYLYTVQLIKPTDELMDILMHELLFFNRWSAVLQPWMKEEKWIIHRGWGAYLCCPVSISVHFSLRNEGSSEYICLCGGIESLSPNFKTFKDPRHKFPETCRLASNPFIILLHSHYTFRTED
jgi:hypothetical protein